MKSLYAGLALSGGVAGFMFGGANGPVVGAAAPALISVIASGAALSFRSDDANSKPSNSLGISTAVGWLLLWFMVPWTIGLGVGVWVKFSTNP
jgi:hypothetical protein